MSEVINARLSNGMPVYGIDYSDLGITSLFYGVFINAGSFDDPKGKEGTAHFLEHMALFTPDRLMPETINKIKYLGASKNASTDALLTYHWGLSKPEDMGVVLSAIGKSIKEPSFDEELYYQQQSIIRNEIDRHTPNDFSNIDKWYHDITQQELGVSVPEGMYGFNLRLLGNHDSFSRITIEDLKAFHKSTYTPDKMCVVMAGAIPQNWPEVLEKEFGSLHRTADAHLPETLRGSRQHIQYATLPLDGVESIDMRVSFRFKVEDFSPLDFAAFSALRNQLCSANFGIAYNELRKKRNILYAIEPNHVYARNREVEFTLRTKSKPSYIEEILKCYARSIRKIAHNQVDRKDLIAIQNGSSVHNGCGFEIDSGVLTETLNRVILFGEPSGREAIFVEQKALTNEKLILAAQKLLADDTEIGVKALGNVSTLPKHEEIRQIIHGR